MPWRRRDPDAPGVRRASEEYGGRRRRRRRPRLETTPWDRLTGRSRKLIRYGKRHKAGVLGWGGILGLLSCYWLLSGALQALTLGVSLAALGGAGAVKWHQHNKVLNTNGSRRPSARETREHYAGMRPGRQGEAAGPGYADVGGYTRADGTRVSGYRQNRKAADAVDPEGDGLSEAERRFFGHRAAGYRGPIDQDGNRVDDLDAWIDQRRGGGR